MIINFFNKNGGSGSGYTLPVATENRLGGVKIGSGITIDAEGHISAEGGSDPELREDIIEGRVVAGMAKQLQSPDGVSVTGSPYVMRTTAGEASVSTGFANLNGVLANTIADEPVYESVNGEYNAIPRYVPNDEIWYTTNDESVCTPYPTTTFGANIISNTYEDGKGVIKFDGPVTSIGLNAFNVDGVKLISIEIPDSVTDIGEQAFMWQDKLSDIVIPSNVGLIDKRAFAYCTGLTSVTCLAPTVVRLSYSVFDSTNTTFKIYVPTELVNEYKSNPDWAFWAPRIQAISEVNDVPSTSDSGDIPTMAIDVATFREAVSETSGVYTFNYDGTAWSPAIADYGITVEGEPIDGDSISVVYVADVTPSPMQNATPTAFYGTGLNSFDKGGEFSTILEGKSINSEGEIVDEEGSYVAFVKAVKDLEDGYIVYGDTGVIGLADSDDVESVEVVEDNDGVVMADKDFIAITTYDIDTLCVHPRWSGYKDTDYEEFRIAKFVIPSTDKDGNDLPAFVAVGDTRNEYDFAGLKYIQRVEVVPFDEELIEQLRISKVWGVDYVFDENNIHMVLDTPVVYDLAAEDNLYWVDDFGIEGFEETEVGAVSHTWYMANLVDKLRRDVVTKDEINIDRLNAVDSLPENPENGQVFALKTRQPETGDFFSWNNTGQTTGYTITINQLPNLTQTIGGWEYYGSHPRLDYNAETGNFIFKTRYSGETEDVYDNIATIEPGSKQTESIGFYSQSGQTGNYNNINWNWTNATALTINFNSSMKVEVPMSTGKYMTTKEKLIRYNSSTGEWGKWSWNNALNSNNGVSRILHYAVIPPEMDGKVLISLSFYTQDTENRRCDFVYDAENSRIIAKDYATGNIRSYIYKGDKDVYIEASVSHIHVAWEEGKLSFTFERGIYGDNTSTRTICSTVINNPHYELLNDSYARASKVLDNFGSYRFPLWNEEGVICGSKEEAGAFKHLYLNATGYSNDMQIFSNGTIPNHLWIPTQAGNNGQVLTSTGGNEPSWVNPNTITGGISFWKGTSDEYDAIATKDPNTFFIIVDE